MRLAPILFVTACTACTAACTGSTAAPLDDDVVVAHAPARAHDHQTITLPGDGHGALWDARAAALLVTDDTHSAIVRWTDREGFAQLATIPPAAKVALGGIVRIPDGRLLVTAFGFGTEGAVMAIDRRATTAVPNLDPARRRLAIAHAGDTVYVAYFVVTGGRPAGGVARVDLAGAEHDAITSGLGKPVGLAVSATTLYVADSHHQALYAYPLGDLRSRTVLAKQLAGADLLTLLPNGDLVTGGNGVVQRITPDGAVSTIASGFEQVRGTTYDEAGRRLFVVEHSAASSRHTLHILPLTL